jgi:hypothetical protein
MNAWRVGAAAVMSAFAACRVHGVGVSAEDAGSPDASEASIGLDAEADANACSLVGSFGSSCDSCVVGSCCAEYRACFSTAECIDVNDCTATCDESVADSGPDGEDCPTACKARHADAAAHFDAWDECVVAKCPKECKL